MTLSALVRAAALSRPRARAGSGPAGDRGDIVLGWLTRITVFLVAGGLVVFDLGSVAVGHLRAQDAADRASQAASSSWQETKNAQAAFNAAAAAVDPTTETADPTSFRIDPDGRAHVTVSHEAVTLMLYRFDTLARYATATATGSRLAVS